MKTRILPLVEPLIKGTDIAIALDFSDVAALGAATDGAPIALLSSIPAGTQVQVLGMKLDTPFDCSGTGNLTLSVGYSGAETALLGATQVALDQSEVLFSTGSGTNYVPQATADINAYFDSSGVNLSTYTTGKVIVYLRVADMNGWPVPL